MKRKGKQLSIKGNLKLKYEAAIFGLQAKQAKLEAKESEIKRRASEDEVFAEALSLMSQRSQLEMDKSKALGKVQVVAKQICKKLDIDYGDFKNYTVDTESGVVLYVPLNKEDE